jgi:hypothetical protein
MKPKLGVTLGGWTTKRKLLATGLFCLSLATPGVASAASSGVPTVDIAITCRTSEKALIAIFVAETQQTFEICMQSENQARAEIVKNWQSYPAGGRQRCVNATGHMPSYVEWLTCLELEQQVNELRKGATTNTATTEGRGARAAVRARTPSQQSWSSNRFCGQPVPYRAICIRWLNHQCDRLPLVHGERRLV